MSYCRFSTDDFKCDLYVYEHCGGGYVTNVACLRTVYNSPLPETIPFDEENALAYFERHKQVMALHKEATTIPIDLPFAGETFLDDTAEDLLSRLLQLKEIGYIFPDYVISTIREEADFE